MRGPTRYWPIAAPRTQDLLLETRCSAEDDRLHPGMDPIAARVGAALFTGAMAELAQRWLTGALGSDLDVVVDHALGFVLR